MVKSSFSFVLGATAPGLMFTVSLDGRSVWTGIARPENDKIIIDFDDNDDGTHELCLEMSGKTHEHTKIDAQGTIILDTIVHVKDMQFDEINVDQIIYEQALYQHNFNGNGQDTQEKFYGSMGCNGTVKFCFTTPVYLWLLENM